MNTDNIAILAVAGDLVKNLVLEVAGNEIGDSIEGVDIPGDMITDTTLAVFQKHLNQL